LTFPLTFALAFVLLYWGRPVGWGSIYLEIVVLLAARPLLVAYQHRLLLGGMLALTASHWLALAITLQGRWLRLFTLQSASWPWETWLVVPLCWVVLLASLPLPGADQEHVAGESAASSRLTPVYDRVGILPK